MKKFLLILILSCLVFSVFALDGVVVDVLGKVEKQSGDSWITLKKGDILVPGDVVSTGFKSEAVLSIGESTVTVRALTRLTIEQLYEKNKNHISSVYLDTGSICADIKPVENKRVGFTVKTPAVTASVRGTAGYVYAYGKVEAIRGKWGLSAPLPKEINYDRGDVAEDDESSSTVVKEESDVELVEQVDETKVTSEENEETAENESDNESDNEQSTKSEDENTDEKSEASDAEVSEAEGSANSNESVVNESATPTSDESVSQQSSSDASMEVEEVDVELESMIAGVNANSEIFVSAGEVAYVNPVQTDVIVTPVEVKKENATNNNIDLSNLENKIVEEFANIIVEIVIQEK